MTLCLCFWPLGTVSADQWFASRHSGTDTVSCGLQQSKPCKTIYQAATRAHDGDVINIDGSGTSRDPYPCESEEGLQLAGVVIRGYGTRAVIACKNSSFRFSCDIKNDALSGVSLAGITFVNTSLYLVGCSLKMAEVNFVNSSVDTLSLSFAQDLTVNVYFTGCIFQNNSANGVKIFGDSVNFEIWNSTFANNNLRNADIALLVISPQTLQAQTRVNFTNITVVHNTCPGEACFKIASRNNGKLTMKIEEGQFENNQAEENVLDISGTSVIELKSVQFRSNSGRAVNIHDGNSVELNLAKGNFVENHIDHWNKIRDGAAIFVHRFKQEALVFMSRSNFSSNQAENGGACAFVYLSSLILNIKSCHFGHNEGWSSGGALTVGTNYNWQEKAAININNSNFNANTLYFRLYEHNPSNGDIPYDQDSGGGGALALYVLDMWNLTLINNTFADNKAEEKKAGAIRANIGTLHREAVFLNCEFLRNSGVTSGTFELSVSYPLPLLQARVTIQNCTFIQNKAFVTGYGLATTYDIFLPYQNYLMISFCKVQNNSGGGIFIGNTSRTSDIRVENTLISDNKNFELSLFNKIVRDASFKFTKVSILRNNCEAKSSIFHVSMYQGKNSLNLQTSKIEDNFCKSGVMKISVTPHVYTYPDKIDINSSTAVIINNTVFRGNSGVAESTLTVFDAKVVNIQNSTFINNFGGNDGSHVRVQLRSSDLKIYKTNFYQSEKSQTFNLQKEKPYSGFLTVTSFGNMSVRESSFVSDPLNYDGVTLIFVRGAAKASMDDSVRIQSSVGSKLKLHNFTHWEILTVGKKFLQAFITSFAMSAQPCPVGTYSIRRGTRNGFANENQVKCLPCPNGANCTSSLAARPNFWGFPIGDQVYFTFCPEGYCCPAVNQKCRYRNDSYLHCGCQGNRTGILCGRCNKDFSEALFSTNCHPVQDCTHRWYLVLIFICTMLFALYLIRKPPVFQKLMTELTWFLPSHRLKDYQDLRNIGIENKTNGTSSFSSDGFLKILFYFYQVAGLLTISSYGVSELLRENIVLPLINLMDFKLYANNGWNICPFPGITPLTKTLFQLVIVMALFLSVLFIYLLHIGLNKLSKRTQVLPQCGPYLGAILEIVLLGYSAATGTAMKLLDCRKIQHVSRWYHNAEVTCFQWWQSASIAAIVLYLFPFIFTLYIGSLRLHRRQISAKKFLLACVFPLPYLLLVSVAHLNKVVTRPHDSQEMTLKSSAVDVQEEMTSPPQCTIENSVLEVLSAPFCKPEQDEQSPGKIYWESILIGRRFILILVAWSVAHAFLRSVCLAVLCLIFLLHHLSQKPFVKFRANLAETVSLTTLVVIAILNVGVASYYSAGAEARGVEQKYVQGFLLTEAVLLGFVPFVFVAFVSFTLASQLVRLLIILIQSARWLVDKTKTYKQKLRLEQGEPLLPSN